MIKKKLIQCPICGVKMREDRLEKHKSKQHTTDVQQKRWVAHKRRRSGDKGASMIRTKVMKELVPGKFFALGFGDVATSNLDAVVVSSFLSRVWMPESAIGVIAHPMCKFLGL